jgi:hypothetical protein
MKTRLSLLSILLIAAMWLSHTASAVAAGATHTPVSAWEIPLCPPYGEGHPNCTQGEWTFPGGNMHVRNMVQVYSALGINDDRLTGTNTLVANANWDTYGYGPGWGTFHNQVIGYDGYWEGTFAAVMSADGYISRIVGKGYGEFEGLVIRATEVNGLFEGVIIELPGD